MAEYKTGLNPILPLWEYIPDGEPHVFGDRIYLFGSHDVEGGTRYCQAGNYVCWSAPLADPTHWQCEGVIYENRQDPLFREGITLDLYAPDVVQGNDGRFYLYYNPVTNDDAASFHNQISVAVSDTPAGHYEYLGFVRHPDGSRYNTYLMADPAVINDDGVIRLYCGWSLSMVAATAHRQGQAGGSASAGSRAAMLPKAGDPEMNRKLAPIYQMIFKRTADQVADLDYPLMGANTLELDDDMMTVRSPIKRIVPGQFDATEESGFKGHAFYEASSIRKINSLYYFIYSSENSHEMCYATSRYPDQDFVYGGTIISNGDIGYQGRKPEDRLNQTANDHGSLECVNGQWYIFHHRQTHRSTFSRQACAEKVTILPNGSIPQVRCTSMGLHDGPLPAEGTYPAPCCCVLTNGHMPHITNTAADEDIPCITNSGDERFIANIKDGIKIGYRYFMFNYPVILEITIASTREATMEIWNETSKVGEIKIPASDEWLSASTTLDLHGQSPLYLTYRGKGEGRLLSLKFA